MDTVKTVVVKPEYLVGARAAYDQKLQEFKDKRQELINTRTQFREARDRFKAEKQVAA